MGRGWQKQIKGKKLSLGFQVMTVARKAETNTVFCLVFADCCHSLPSLSGSTTEPLCSSYNTRTKSPVVANCRQTRTLKCSAGPPHSALLKLGLSAQVAGKGGPQGSSTWIFVAFQVHVTFLSLQGRSCTSPAQGPDNTSI